MQFKHLIFYFLAFAKNNFKDFYVYFNFEFEWVIKQNNMADLSYFLRLYFKIKYLAI